MLNSLLFPVLPTLQEGLHTNQAGVTWVLTTYLLSASVSTPILGRLGDRYGKKRMFELALGVLTAGALLAAVATTLDAMIVARAIQGAGGGVIPLSFGITHEALPDAEVPRAIGIISADAGAGGGVGLFLAGPIVELLGYQRLFWIPLLPTVVAAVTAHLVIGDSRTHRTANLRWQAFALLTTWLIALLLAISQGGEWGWLSARTALLVLGAAAVGAVWVRLETRSVTPLIDMRMMRLRPVWSNNLVTFLVGICAFASQSFTAELAQAPNDSGYGFGASVTEAGLMIAPQTVATIVVGAVVGRLMARFGSKVILVWGGLACSDSVFRLAFLHDAKWQIYLGMTLLGTGVCMVLTSQANLIVTAVSPEQTGVAAGMNAYPAHRRLDRGGGDGQHRHVHRRRCRTVDELRIVYGFVLLGATAALGAAAGVFVPSPRRAEHLVRFEVAALGYPPAVPPADRLIPEQTP